jgi:Mrp family chromosome partitioning ATPase
MRFFWQKHNQSTKLIVLLAECNPEPKLVEFLAKREDVILRETFTTRGVIRGLPDADLVVLGRVIPLWDVGENLMRNTLESTKIPVTSSDSMLARPEEWLANARLSSRKKLQYLPSRFVLVGGWAGGVGKSTLALAVAKRFRERNLPAAFFEATEGGSYLVSRSGVELHTLYDVITGEQEPSEWEGVKLYPLDYRSSSMLSEDPRLPDFLANLKTGYTLVIVDASPNHPFWPRLLDLATTVFIVTNPRDDSLFQAETLLKELAPVRKARPDLQVHIIMNMVRTIGQRIGAAGLVSASLPYDERMANQLDRKLADPLLEILYPGWSAGGNAKAARKLISVEKSKKPKAAAGSAK